MDNKYSLTVTLSANTVNKLLKLADKLDLDINTLMSGAIMQYLERIKENEE